MMGANWNTMYLEPVHNDPKDLLQEGASLMT